jgi:hypothetical protein
MKAERLRHPLGQVLRTASERFTVVDRSLATENQKVGGSTPSLATERASELRKYNLFLQFKGPSSLAGVRDVR